MYRSGGFGHNGWRSVLYYTGCIGILGSVFSVKYQYNTVQIVNYSKLTLFSENPLVDGPKNSRIRAKVGPEIVLEKLGLSLYSFFPSMNRIDESGKMPRFYSQCPLVIKSVKLH